MKIEEILDYKLKKLLGERFVLVTADDKKFILAQAKTKIQAYCHRKDMPKAIYYIWADIAIEVLKGVVDGDVYSFDQLKTLSQLPSYETLLTQLAAGMLGTVSQLAIGLNMLVEKQQEA